MPINLTFFFLLLLSFFVSGFIIKFDTMAAASTFSDRTENIPPNNFDIEKASIYTIEEKTQNNNYNESQQQQHTLEEDPSGM